MQLKYWKNINPSSDAMQKISCLCWSPNGKRLAVCSPGRVIWLFDDQGEKRDQFPTKGSDKGQKTYTIRGMEFSPDSSKIAIAQSDNIVFIYKIGMEWKEKKSICNKFPTASSVTCMAWGRDRPNEIVFGLAEGKVRVGVLKNNKSQVLYNADSYCVSLGMSRDGDGVVSGHLDGSVYVFSFMSQNAQKVIQHHCVPQALGWGENIMIAGNDSKISIYDSQGNALQRFDYTNDEKVRDFTFAAVNPTGDTIVMGNYNRFYIFNFNKRTQQWEELGIKVIENYYTVTCGAWKHDGSKLAIASLCGSVDLYDASLRKIMYKGKFEFNYVSPNQAVIKTIATGNRVVIKSNHSSEITRINICQDRFVIANTLETILVGDLETNKISEIHWSGNMGKEKYDFTNPNICMIFNAGELTLVEYGDNEPLGTCRTEFVKPSLISARINCSSVEGEDQQKIIAFMLDQQTINIMDFATQQVIGSISHDAKIDFLELNAHANKLLFRDKRRQLFLYNIKLQAKNTLLNFCSYAQWVPDSEVVVAQNRTNLCVWYSIDNPDKQTIYSVKGDVEEIQRIQGKTEVIVNEGNNLVSYTLDEPLIDFGFAIESGDLEKAASYLDPLDMNPETEANWKTLAQKATEEQNINVAEHCYAALGDIAKAAYLRKINKLIQSYEKETGQQNGLNYYKVQAKLACLEKQFHTAEALLLDNNEIEEAMEMYQELHKWSESIKIAEKKNYAEVNELKAQYFDWLITTNQEEKAAEVKENQGEFLQAINLYLKGGLPARAANIVFNYDIQFPQGLLLNINKYKDILEKIANNLSQAGMHERAGEFYEQMDLLQKALDCYCKGNAYKKAVDLAKEEQPKLVVNLEERWGDWLVSQKQTLSAINHYIEANNFTKAIEASISAKQWPRAVQLLQSQPPEVTRPFYKQIAKHYADVRQYDLAEKYYIQAGCPTDAFEMYTKANKWDLAQKVAKDNLPEPEIQQLYIRSAQKFESQSMLKEAEQLYLTVNQPDYAIEMYKKIEQYDNMIRLVSRYRREFLKKTHEQISIKYENGGNFKQAEQHLIEAQLWQKAVAMYQKHGLWEEAIRCCRINGTEKDTSEIAKKWAESLGREEGIKMLRKHNLIDAHIEYLIDRREFDEAFKLAEQNSKHKVSDVHLKYATSLENEKRYKEAEDHYIKASKPAQAIEMYSRLGDFMQALQIARQYEPSQKQSILIKQGQFCVEKGDFLKAENAFISAKKPEMAIQIYRSNGRIEDAIRVATKHAAHLLPELSSQIMDSSGGQMSGEELLNAGKLFESQRNFDKAIETYLQIRREHFSNHDILEEVWERAVQLSLNYSKNNSQEVMAIVSQKLIEIQRYDQAAEFYENIGQVDKAIQTYISAGSRDQLERAKQLIQQLKNPQQQKQFLQMIQQRMGTPADPLEDLANQGNWSACLDAAQKKGKDFLQSYLMKFAKATMENGKFGETVGAFAKYGIQPVQQNFGIYKTLILEVLAEYEPTEIQNLRIMLFNFLPLLGNDPSSKEFQKYALIAHLLNQKLVYEKKGVKELHVKICIALLRYSDLVRLDKLYYDAGIACKKEPDLSKLGFVLLNRYLDIYELIEDPDNNNIEEQQEFELTDIPPLDQIALPEKNFISEPQKNEINDWLLQVSLDQKLGSELPTRSCDYCNQSIYSAAVTCYSCKRSLETCIISGWPLNPRNSQKCRSCGKGGIKEMWTLYQQNFANCPWCANPPF